MLGEKYRDTLKEIRYAKIMINIDNCGVRKVKNGK